MRLAEAINKEMRLHLMHVYIWPPDNWKVFLFHIWHPYSGSSIRKQHKSVHSFIQSTKRISLLSSNALCVAAMVRSSRFGGCAATTPQLMHVMRPRWIAQIAQRSAAAPDLHGHLERIAGECLESTIGGRSPDVRSDTTTTTLCDAF